MTEFKHGGIYVDDATGAVWSCYEGEFDDRLLLRPLTKTGLKKDEFITNEKLTFYKATKALTYGYLNICFYYTRSIDIFLRPWQASDEPTEYDVERWGKVVIGRVYKNIRSSVQRDCTSYLSYALGDVAAYIMYWHKKEGVPDKDPIHKLHTVAHFYKDITRPAFDNEIAELQLPQLTGEI